MFDMLSAVMMFTEGRIGDRCGVAGPALEPGRDAGDPAGTTRDGRHRGAAEPFISTFDHLAGQVTFSLGGAGLDAREIPTTGREPGSRMKRLTE